MTEYYKLPILFNEEERENYARWGIKKSKTLIPFATITILIDLVVTIVVLLYFLGFFDGSHNLNIHLSAFGGFTINFLYNIAIILTIIIIKPIDWILDLIFKKPKEPKMLRLEPTPQGVAYKLIRKKDLICEGVLSWEQWKSAVYPNTNQIVIQNQWLKIGENTIETIYPREYQKKFMDRPAEKIVGTINFKKIQKNFEGYLASLEAKKKEEEWAKNQIVR